MSASGNGHGNQSHAGTAGAPASGAPGNATGQVRSYGMGHGGSLGGYPCDPTVGQQSNPGGAGQQRYPSGAAQGQVLRNGAVAGQVPQSAGSSAQAGQGMPYYGQSYGQGPYGQAPFGQAAYHMPPTSQPQQLKKRRRWPVVVGILVALMCVAAAILLALSMCDGGASRRQGDAGQLKGKSEAEIQAELDRVVEEGMFNISIASVVELESGTSEGELRIENVPGNRYLMQVTLVRNDTGEQLYQTDIIEPNHHIQSDALDVVLPAGTYECTALFKALDPETEEEVGQAAAVVTVNVRG